MRIAQCHTVSQNGVIMKVSKYTKEVLKDKLGEEAAHELISLINMMNEEIERLGRVSSEPAASPDNI